MTGGEVLGNLGTDSEPKPDYKFIARVNEVKDARCEVFLPHSPGESAKLQLHTDLNLKKIPMKFSVEGDIVGFDGTLQMKIIANNVFLKGGRTSYWSKDMLDTLVIGEPTDLTVTEYIKPDSEQKISDTVRGYFMVQPRWEFPFMKSLELSYTGEINVIELDEYKFTISPGVDLIFDEYYRFTDRQAGQFTCTPEIVARFETNSDTLKKICDFNEIDDLLMLISLANQKRYMCMGYVISDSNTRTTYYRFGVGLDSSGVKQHIFNELIKRSDWSEFVVSSYNRMCSLDNEKRGLFRRAINCGIPNKNEVFESSYMSLYAGIESLVELFSKEHSASRKVLKNEQWVDFRKGYERLIGEVLKKPGDETPQQKTAAKSKALMDKLGSINCYPMGTAFELMRTEYNVNLEDLWPVYDTGKKKSDLSWIRNQLGHGRVIPHDKYHALIGAKEHLKWTLERLILGFIGWPVEKSNVSKKFLANHMACYCSLQKDRSNFQ